MWKKEITDTLKQTGFVLSFILLVPVIFGINQLRLTENKSFFVYMLWGLTFALPSLAFYMAYSMFASDDSQEASEYLKSLPVSKWKLLAMKMLPRLIVILTLTLICNALLGAFWPRTGISTAWSAFGIEGFSKSIFMLLLVLISGFFLGISDRKNPVLAFAFLIPILFFYLGESGTTLSRKLLYSYYFNIMEPNGIEISKSYLVFNIGQFLAFVTAIGLPAILPLLAIIPEYTKWDCSSERERSQGILKKMAAPLLLIVGLYSIEQFHLLG